jgi:hypothetical protein
MYVLIPWHVEDAAFTVKVELPGVSSGFVSDIYGAGGDRIPTLDWEACGFTDFQLELCVARALNEDAHECKGEKCPC